MLRPIDILAFGASRYPWDGTLVSARFLELVDLFYPAVCAGCGARAHDGLCPACYRSLSGAGPVVEQMQNRPGPFNGRGGLKAAGRYSGPLREMVLGLKSGRKMYAAHLGALMVAATGNDPAFVSPHAVVPVPSTRAKMARRGYNPALLLAGEVARRLDCPLLEALVKTRRTADQDVTPGYLRAGNVSGAFAVVRGLELAGDVLLVDDVLTTGATADACSEALIEAGAWSVQVLVAAHAVLRAARFDGVEEKSPWCSSAQKTARWPRKGDFPSPERVKRQGL